MRESTFVPRSELNVREIFAQRADRLGYRIVESRAAFPDYLLEHEGERILAEAEFKTSNFLRHRHDLARCDLIIVWQHDLPTMPMPVLELSSEELHVTRPRGRPPRRDADGVSDRPANRRVWRPVRRAKPSSPPSSTDTSSADEQTPQRAD